MIALVAQSFAFIGAGLMLLLLIWVWPTWAISVTISVAVLLDCFQVGDAGIDLGVNLFVDDAAAAVLLVAAFVALVRNPKSLSRDLIPCAVLLAMVALNLIRGVRAFGVKPAGNSARNLLMFAAPALTIMVLRPVMSMDSQTLGRWLGWAGCTLGSIAMLRWVGALAMPLQLEDNLREVVRALPSDYAIVIGQAFIAVIYLQVSARSARWWWAVAGMLGIVTIFLQHRSVWVATASGLGWLAVRTARRSSLRWFVLAGAGAIAVGVMLMVSPALLETVDSLISTNIRETQGSSSTWAWRMQGFTEATQRALGGDTADMLIGPPGGWASNSGASFASVHIHNRYVDTLAYYGLFGLAVLLVWLSLLAKRVSQVHRTGAKNSCRNRSASTLLQALLLSEIVYLVPYFGGLLQGAVLGLIWVAASHCSPLPGRGGIIPERTVGPCAKEPAIP